VEDGNQSSPESALQHDLESERALLREAVRRQRILSEVSRILLDYTGEDDIEPLRRIVDRVVEALGDWCAFSLIQSDGLMKNVASYHPAARQRELALRAEELVPRQRWDAPPAELNPLLQKRPIVYESISDEMLRASLPSEEAFRVYKEIGLSSLIIAPMIIAGEPMGTLVLASTGQGGLRYSGADIDFVFSLASRAALAVRNARLVRALNYERREAERRAAELFAVLHSDPNGVALFGPDGRLRFCSPSLDTITTYKLSAQVGRHYRDLLMSGEVPRPPDATGAGLAHVDAIFADQASTARDLIKLGQPPRDVIRSTSPVVSPGGDYLGRLFVYVDVTAERELDRQRADFLTIAAHEMRTPLTPLSMYLQTIERRQSRGLAIDPQLIAKSRRQVTRLERLVQDLLDVSRLDAGRVELRLEDVPLDALVDEVAADFRAGSRQHELVVERPAAPLLVPGDRERLEQVVVNLLQNAIKYSPRGGRISVRVFPEGREAVVEVTDQGIGIPAEEHTKLFKRFFRARNAAASNYGGLGIGLYVSHDIIERHGGRFEVESQVGKGTTFRFRLPVSDGASPKPAPRPRRILLVDDDPDIIEATAGFLEDEGFTVMRAHDGRSALEQIRHDVPDLMLIDLMMPILDGWALIDRIQTEKLAAGVPMVVFSADRDVRQKAAELGADAVLRKPFSLEELQELVTRLLGKPRAEP